MARHKKGKLFQLFKDRFKITFFYKPSMIDDDIFYYIILEDVIKLKIKLIYGAIVVDDIIPLSSVYLAKEYETLIDIFIHQTDFTVLISLTGNTIAFSSACIKINAPIVDDPRFLCIPRNLYDNLRDYYKDDTSKYGFYLLAVKDIPEGEPEQQSVEAGKIPLIDKIMTKLQDTFNHKIDVVTEYDSWALGKILNINGIKFKLTYDENNKIVGLHNFMLDEMDSFMDLLTLCSTLEQYAKRANIILYNVMSNQLVNICESRGYKNLRDNSKNTLSINQKYQQSIFGDYRIEKIY